LPDGESENFFAQGLDSPNQPEMLRENRFLAHAAFAPPPLWPGIAVRRTASLPLAYAQPSTIEEVVGWARLALPTLQRQRAQGCMARQVILPVTKLTTFIAPAAKEPSAKAVFAGDWRAYPLASAQQLSIVDYGSPINDAPAGRPD
jgi:hypothetical protein